MRDLNRDDKWTDSYGSSCIYCGSPIRSHEAARGNRECSRCRYGDDLGPIEGPVMNRKGDGSYPMDFDFYSGDEGAPSQAMRDLVNAKLCRGFCVECKAPMAKAERLASLACPRCVEKLGTDEETGRWDGKPEPSKDQKKGAA